MRIRKPGKIREQLWLLGREESCVYLLESQNESMIISGGMSYLVPGLLQQFEAFGIDENRISKLLILHAHFDHLGIIPFFKRRHPKAEVYASGRGWAILRNRKAIQAINELSQLAVKRMGREGISAKYDLDWRNDFTGTTVSEGDRIDLTDLAVRIFETPGHSSCSISAYVPELKALFASDGGGIPYRDKIFAFGNSNFAEYQRSLRKLEDLNVAYVCADHYGYVAGEEARNFVRQTMEAAKEAHVLMEEAYQHSGGDIETAARRVTQVFFSENPDWVVSPDIVEGVNRQMLRHIASVRKEGQAPLLEK